MRTWVGTLSDVTAVAKAGAGAGVCCTTDAAEYIIVGVVETGIVSSSVVSGEGAAIVRPSLIVSLPVEISVSVMCATSFGNMGWGQVIRGGVGQGRL